MNHIKNPSLILLVVFGVLAIGFVLYSQANYIPPKPKVEILSNDTSAGASSKYLLKFHIDDADSVYISAGKFFVSKDLFNKDSILEQEVPLPEVNTIITVTAIRRFEGVSYDNKATLTIQRDKTPEDIAKEEKGKKEQEEFTKYRAEAEADATAWKNSSQGKVCQSHGWNRDLCDRIFSKEIWLGMSIDMLKAQRGLPSSANPSNYGTGTQWQWCWWNKTPMCFYGGENGIVTSYN